MKYVIFKGNGCFHPVLFAEHTTHKQIRVEGADPVSAGFVRFRHGFPVCYGWSESLKLRCNKDLDEEIIRKWQIDCGMNSFIDLDNVCG